MAQHIPKLWLVSIIVDARLGPAGTPSTSEPTSAGGNGDGRRGARFEEVRARERGQQPAATPVDVVRAARNLAYDKGHWGRGSVSSDFTMHSVVVMKVASCQRRPRSRRPRRRRRAPRS